ncbi:MBL fold metallo-hydrolase [Cohnella sp. CFH 77786]|uniref:MBL fold metallo-hydrolase n=1 Tax=Cohnella sp. CFH 77786 TaxID=2662265 RepID=UPI001C61114F|nr:MBL fold metallo-hydrolase [Cohnella sp. CFH 77786]MBW5448161.1 MBL fold metallo-hydrolase [Cohnella sp. CFH 77786]
MEITFLGHGDSLGTPRVYCECAVCEEARTTGANRRLRSSLWLREKNASPLLLDCGPDWREQMESIGVRNAAMGLLTHAHFDHIGGLVDWADACRWTDVHADVFAPAEVLEEVLRRFPWIGSRLRLHANDEGMEYGGWNVRPWKVNHGKNGYSYAYRFDRPQTGKSWAYCSDSINLSEAEKEPLRGLELLILGTSFAEEPFPMDTRSVYDMKEGLALAAEVGAGKVLFTHLSHDVDSRRDYGLPSHVRLGETGMTARI